MKLTTILLTAAVLHAAAKTTAQTITYTAKGVSLQQFFSVVEKQAGYVFFYDKQDVASIQPLDVDLQNVPVTIAMDRVLSDQPLDFEIQGNTIFVSKKNAPKRTLVEMPQSPTKAPPVKGRVVNENGEPIVGATVKVKGTNRITTTNSNGEFSIEADNTAILVITATNIETQEIKLNGRTELTIAAKTKVSDLDETVVLAYSKTSKRFLTGNATTVTAKQIENQPLTNPLIALQGQVPGLIISQASGYANAGVTVQIQGPNSLKYGNVPFYVIDGVPYPNQNLESIATGVLGASGNLNGIQAAGFNVRNGNPLSFINPQDIESISILKDADATAIYGSQAANGAIIITTKKGKAGTSKVSLNLQHGIAQDKRFLKLMNREQYMKMRNEAYFVADGLTTSSPRFASQYDLNGTWDTTRTTDWQKELLGGTAKYTNLQGSISGGTAQDQYLLSVNYNRQTTIFSNKLADQKGAVHLSLDHSSFNNRFKVHTAIEYMLDNNQLPSYDLTDAAYALPPVAPALYKSDRSINWQLDANGIPTFFENPLGATAGKTQNITKNLVGNLSMSYQLMKNLILSSSAGYTSMQQDEVRTFPTILPVDLVTQWGLKGSSSFSNGNQNSWILEPSLNYNTILGNGKLDAFVGATYRRNYMKYQSFNAENYSTNQLLEDIRSAGRVRVNNSSISEYRYAALFGRLGYNWNQKYLMNLNIRRDGSSRFGSNNLFHDFWSIAGGWIFSEEKLVKEKMSWLSFGKLNASYGSTGSDNIIDYSFLAGYGAAGQGVVYQGMPVYYVGGLPNPNIQWEETRKLNLGISLGFLKDRILVEANHYRNRCSNQLLEYMLPVITGFGGVLANFPATVQNTGWEFTVRATPLKNQKFQWTSTLNMSINRNKLVSFPNIETSSYSAFSYLIGKPIDFNLKARFAGVDPVSGMYQFYKADGSLTTNPASPGDYTASVSLLPKFTGGWSNQFSYNQFSVDILFQFAKQTKSNQLLIGYYNQPGGMVNQLAQLDYWTSSHGTSNLQKLTTGANRDLYWPYSSATNSDAILVDGSYMRLKNLSVSYQLLKSWTKKVGMSDCRILLSGQNLLTITKFKGVDPETGAAGLPPLRILTVGIRADF